MAIEVMLVDDHEIVRRGIRFVISREHDMKIVAEASDGKEAVRLAVKKSPDVVVMDIALPLLNGLEASHQILKRNKNVKIVILSMYDNRGFIEKALQYGIQGYLLKDSAADEIVPAVREVMAGRCYLSSKVSSVVVHSFVSQRKGKSKVKSISLLTSREREILQLVTEGLSSKEIADKLGVALKTVLVHRTNIMNKLDIHNQAQLIRFALKEGISSL